jgi:iron complex transport system substrate-binding protein
MHHKFILFLVLSLALSACAGAALVETPEIELPTVEATPLPLTQPAPTKPLPTSTQPSDPEPTATLEPIIMRDGAGTQVRLLSPAQRVVSLAPSNTEIMFAVGAGAQLVARDSFSDYPPEAQALESIGDVYGGLNLELILSLQPDLVLAAAITPPEQVAALREAGLTVFVVGNPTSMEDLYTKLGEVAQLTGRSTEAAELVVSLQKRVSAVLEVLAGLENRPHVFYELDGTEPNAPWTAGPGSFIDLLIQMSGGENIAASLDGEWVQISLEALIEADPDLIILGDAYWGGVTPEDVASRSGWDALSAVVEGKVLPFDDNLVSRPGPRLVDGLEQLARIFHPALFH